MRIFAKSPTEMRREAEQRGKPKPGPLPSGSIDPATRPLQASETPPEVDATMEWLAHIQAGRIEVR